MSAEFFADPPPLRRDDSGAIRVGGSRVLLELVIALFQDGASPAQIVEAFDSISLADAYGAVAYYLRHRDQIDAYMAEREGLARVVRAKLDAAGVSRVPAEVLRRLAARRS